MLKRSGTTLFVNHACRKSVQVKARNMTNPFQHLREPSYPFCSSRLLQKYIQNSYKQSKVSAVIVSTSKYSLNSAQTNELNCAVAYYLAKDAVPLCTVNINRCFNFWRQKLTFAQKCQYIGQEYVLKDLLMLFLVLSTHNCNIA